MSEELEADPAHVKRCAGRINRQRHEVAVVGVLSDGIQQGVAHRWHQLRENNRIPKLLRQAAGRAGAHARTQAADGAGKK